MIVNQPFIKTPAEIYQEIYQEYVNSPLSAVSKDKISRLANKMAVQLTWKRFNAIENKIYKKRI